MTHFKEHYFLNKYKIYIDLDGVLADFMIAFKNIRKLPGGMNLTPTEFEDKYGDQEFYDLVKKQGKKFWSQMSWMIDGKMLWNYLKKYNPIILTTPMDFDECYEGKTEWVKNNLGRNVECIIIKDKTPFAEKNAILIDDREKILKPFIEKGGIGIHHKNSILTIKTLKDNYGL
jgi:5'(3')-deoxyribonucleotidase